MWCYKIYTIIERDERVQVILLHNFNIELENLKKLIKGKMEHRYLKKFFENPMIDVDKLALLTMIVNNANLLKERKQDFIIATTLIQVAQDIHELVPIENLDSESELDITRRQLSVLSGDYYSGLYYLLLSEIEEIDMIRVVALTVKEINEYKMKLYFKEFNTFDEYIKLTNKIESLIIVRVSEYLGLSALSVWAERMILTSMLSKEKIRFHNKETAPILDKWLNHSPGLPHDSILREVEYIINDNLKYIEKHILESKDEPMFHETQIRYMLDYLMFNATSVTKEV